MVFNEISDRLRLETYIDVDGDKEEDIIRGDLGNKFSPAKTSRYQRLLLNYDVELVSSNGVMNTGAFRHLRSKNKNKKRAVIFGDSYTNAGLETIAYYFEETYFFWQANIFDLNVLDRIRPDVVINETAERFFNGQFQNKKYKQVLWEKILSLDGKELDKVNLEDDFYDPIERKMLNQYRLTKKCH